MAFEKGTLIFANYTATVKDTGEAVETTLEDEAKKLKIYDAGRKYEPRLVAVGEGWLIAGLDDEIKGMEVGQRKKIELLPEKAFGKRDPTQVRMIPLRKFGDREHELQVGDAVDVDNRGGIVRFIGSGRAQVDFNHRLAGKAIVYDFEVLSKVDSDKDKVRALIERRFAGEGGKVNFELLNGTLKVTLPEDLYLLEGLQIIKRGISNDVFKFVPSVSELTFVEKFVNEKASKVEERKSEKTEEAPPSPKPRRKKAAAATQAA